MLIQYSQDRVNLTFPVISRIFTSCRVSYHMIDFMLPPFALPHLALPCMHVVVV